MTLRLQYLRNEIDFNDTNIYIFLLNVASNFSNDKYIDVIIISRLIYFRGRELKMTKIRNLV